MESTGPWQTRVATCFRCGRKIYVKVTLSDYPTDSSQNDFGLSVAKGKGWRFESGARTYACCPSCTVKRLETANYLLQNKIKQLTFKLAAVVQ